MNDIRIQLASGTTRRLLTSGTYCANNIIVEALKPKLVTLIAKDNGVYDPANYDSADGFGNVEINVPARPKPSGRLIIKRTIADDASFIESVTKDSGETAYEEVEVQLTLADSLIIPSQIKNIDVYANDIDVYNCSKVNITIPKYNGESANVITFVIKGPERNSLVEYEAVEGMSWYEWINNTTHNKQGTSFICAANDKNPVYIIPADTNQEFQIQGNSQIICGQDIINPAIAYYY